MNPKDLECLRQTSKAKLFGALRDHPNVHLTLNEQRIGLPLDTRMRTVSRVCELLVKEDEIGYHLIRQKDHIRGLISKNRLTEAANLLYFLEPLWIFFDYHYKFAELMIQIDEAKKQ